jgi:hypothetical protein
MVRRPVRQDDYATPMQESPDVATGEHRHETACLAALPCLIRLALLIAVVAPCLLIGAAALVLVAYVTR